MEQRIKDCILIKNNALESSNYKCNGEKCKTCGWNPTVAAARKKMKLRLGNSGLYSLSDIDEETV